VTPYEAGPVQPIDPKPAWDEAVAVFKYYRNEAKALPAPPQWPTLVAAHEPAVALAFCAGNFPQLVRNFHLILQKANPADLRPQPGRATEAPALLEWADKVEAKGQFPQVLEAVGALRVAKQFDKANDIVKAFDAKVPAEWQAAWANEKAALLWHQGEGAKARDLWKAMPASTPVLFNRGMAELFLGNKEQARISLTEAIAQLPESSAWHHLGRLYLTLANR
jgi:tetratricopeptide (TPR) repeat protein